MKSQITLLAATFALSLPCSLLRAQAPNAKEPDDLDRLRRDYLQRRADALKPVTTWYQTQLEALQRKLTQSNNLEGALFVRRELESIRENSAQEGHGELQKALLATKWSWASKPGDKGVQMTFKDDGTVSHIGMHGTWQITGPREVNITTSDGDKIVLRFDTNLKNYNQAGGPIRGRPWQ